MGKLTKKQIYDKKWRQENPVRYAGYFQKKYYKDVEESRRKQREYYARTIERQREYRKLYKREKFRNDLQYRLRVNCSTRIRSSLKSINKAFSTIELLGCSAMELRAHLEKQFDSKMNWDNYPSYWEIDHITPCHTFDLTNPEEQKKCFHYTNLRPLEKPTNRGRKENRKMAG